jgi:glycine/D-amino acid oxidase-like deaminating enzyme
VRGTVLIIGAGIIGAACARTLSRSGMEATIVDRGKAVGGTLSSGEGTLLVSDRGPGADLELAQYSLRLWHTLGPALESEMGQGFPSIGFEAKGGAVVALDPQQSEALIRFADGKRRAGVDAQPLSVDDAQRNRSLGS